MSRHHSTIAGEISHTIHSIEKMTNSEVERFYGIEITVDGVFDPTYNMKFNSICEWATFFVEQDHEEQYESIDEFQGWG